MPDAAKAPAGEAVPDGDLNIEAVLARFGGDAQVALAAALSDIARLQQELAFASLTMSYGFARGWRPACA